MKINGYEVKKGADLRGANLHGADLRGADLREANLQEANLQRADLQEVNLYKANLQGADLRWAKLLNSNISYANRIAQFSVQNKKRIGYAVDHDDTVMFKLGCFWGDTKETLEAVEKKYGKESRYYKTVEFYSTYFKEMK